MGVIGFVRSLASEVGKYGITAKCDYRWLDSNPAPRSRADVSVAQFWAHSHPKRSARADEPHDIANVVSIFGTPGFRRINGQTLNVDGVARH